MGAAPSVVWASGVVFVALFWLLVPLAIWIYALVFALSSLWFAHFCLAALEQLRREAVTQGAAPDACACPEPGLAAAHQDGGAMACETGASLRYSPGRGYTDGLRCGACG
jgi:hypothetical protein